MYYSSRTPSTDHESQAYLLAIGIAQVLVLSCQQRAKGLVCFAGRSSEVPPPIIFLNTDFQLSVVSANTPLTTPSELVAGN